jgi:hypothetical protein
MTSPMRSLCVLARRDLTKLAWIDSIDPRYPALDFTMKHCPKQIIMRSNFERR